MHDLDSDNIPKNLAEAKASPDCRLNSNRVLSLSFAVQNVKNTE